MAASFNVSFAEAENLSVSFGSSDFSFSADFGDVVVVHGGEVYAGPYTVTPRAWDETVLETSEKYMTDDVTVLRIPYYETSNNTGYTVYIADEV
jgi:hypothetical protein